VVLRARGRRTTPHLVVGVTGHDARPPTAARSTPQLHEVGDLITAAERRALDATPFSEGTKGCSVCHTPPPTAGDVARHYLVLDLRDKNLGECPSKWDD
jgi:hypothetical protein